MLFVVRWLYWKFVSIKGLAVKWSMAKGEVGVWLVWGIERNQAGYVCCYVAYQITQSAATKTTPDNARTAGQSESRAAPAPAHL